MIVNISVYLQPQNICKWLKKIVNNINCQYSFGRTKWGGGGPVQRILCRYCDESKPFFWLRIALIDMMSLHIEKKKIIKIQKIKNISFIFGSVNMTVTSENEHWMPNAECVCIERFVASLFACQSKKNISSKYNNEIFVFCSKL